jgi:hypothetical protein
LLGVRGAPGAKVMITDPYAGVTRIRFQGSSTFAPWRGDLSAGRRLPPVR